MKLLELLSDYGALPLKEIAAGLDVAPAKAWNLLNAACATGYIRKVGRGFYCSGGKLALLAVGGRKNALGTELESALQTGACNLHERMILMELRGSALCMVRNFSREGIAGEEPGFVLDSLYRWATGRAMLAAEGEAFRRIYLARRGVPSAGEWAACPDEAALTEECEKIVQAGYAEIATPDHCAFAVALSRPSGGNPWAVGITFPASHSTKIFRQNVLNTLNEIRRKS